MAMIQCPNCNSTIDDTGAAFCPNCGTPLAQQQPAYQEPAQPAVQPAQPEQPVYQEPVQQPVYQQPVYQQPVYQQPVYQQPVYQQAAPTGPRKNGVGTAGFVLGLIALIFFAIGVIVFYANPFAAAITLVMLIIALILSIPGLVLSIVGVCKRNAKKGLAATGLAFNAVTVIFFFVVLGAISAFLS